MELCVCNSANEPEISNCLVGIVRDWKQSVTNRKNFDFYAVEKNMIIYLVCCSEITKLQLLGQLLQHPLFKCSYYKEFK